MYVSCTLMSETETFWPLNERRTRVPILSQSSSGPMIDPGRDGKTCRIWSLHKCLEGVSRPPEECGDDQDDATESWVPAPNFFLDRRPAERVFDFPPISTNRFWPLETSKNAIRDSDTMRTSMLGGFHYIFEESGGLNGVIEYTSVRETCTTIFRKIIFAYLRIQKRVWQELGTNLQVGSIRSVLECLLGLICAHFYPFQIYFLSKISLSVMNKLVRNFQSDRSIKIRVWRTFWSCARFVTAWKNLFPYEEHPKSGIIPKGSGLGNESTYKPPEPL
jgi:hypothetical protein